MKKQIKKISLLIIVVLCLSIHDKISAQLATTNMVSCGYYVYNHRNCDITVHYEVSDCNAMALPPSTVACGTGIICNSTGMVIPAGTFTFLPCCVANPGSFTSPPCYSPGGDVFIWLKEIDYKDVTGGNANQSVSGLNCLWAGGTVGGAPVPSTVSSPCNTPPSWSIVWSSGGTDIW